MVPHSCFSYTMCWLDVKMQESESAEERSCRWYPWQLKLFNFFFSSQRSEAKWEVAKNYIPPTHLRLPRSLFSFGSVLGGSAGARWQNQAEGDEDGGALHTRTLTSSWQGKERMMDSLALIRLPLTDFSHCMIMKRDSLNVGEWVLASH